MEETEEEINNFTVANSDEMSFEALLAQHRAQDSQTKFVEVEEVQESEVDGKEAIEAKEVDFPFNKCE